MEDNPELDQLDQLDRLARGLDGLLEPKGALVLAACIMVAHLTLLALVGGAYGLPSLHAFITDVLFNLGLGLEDGPILMLSALCTGAVASVLGAACMLSAGLARTGRTSRVVLAAFVIPPWLLHSAWPMYVANELGMPAAAWASAGFLLGLLGAWRFEEHRA